MTFKTYVKTLQAQLAARPELANVHVMANGDIIYPQGTIEVEMRYSTGKPCLVILK